MRCVPSHRAEVSPSPVPGPLCPQLCHCAPAPAGHRVSVCWPRRGAAGQGNPLSHCPSPVPVPVPPVLLAAPSTPGRRRRHRRAFMSPLLPASPAGKRLVTPPVAKAANSSWFCHLPEHSVQGKTHLQTLLRLCRGGSCALGCDEPHKAPGAGARALRTGVEQECRCRPGCAAEEAHRAPSSSSSGSSPGAGPDPSPSAEPGQPRPC